MKVCRKCNKEQPLENYYKSKAGTRDGRRHECKVCWNSSSLEYYLANKERINEAGKEYHYTKTYGITRDEFKQMVADGSGCEVCGFEHVVLDHCHDSGVIRGLLCNKCNQALGSLKDDPKRIVKLSEYMFKHLHLKKHTH